MTARPPNVLLLGAGYTLTKLAHALPRNSVVLSVTSPEKQSQLLGLGYQVEVVELNRSDSLSKLFQKYQSIDTVIDSVPPPRFGDVTAGAQALLKVMPSTVSRLFYLSSTGVYGKTDGSWVTEESGCTPISPSGEARLHVEELYFSQAPCPVTSFRLSGIYGPGRGVGLRMRDGTYTLTDDDSRFTNRVHVDDIVGILHQALHWGERLPSILNVSDDAPALATEVVDYYIKRFDFSPPLRLERSAAQEVGRHRLLLNQRVDNRFVKKIFSYEFTFPSYRAGAGSEFAEGAISS